MNNNNELERAVGRIEGTLGLILENQSKADKGRSKLHHNIEAIRLDNQEHKNQTAAIERRVAIVEKNTADFNKWKERATGALMIISGAAALVGGAFAASWQKILEIFK